MPMASQFAPVVLAAMQPHYIVRPRVSVTSVALNGSLNWGSGWDLTGQVKEITINQSVDNASGTMDVVFKKGRGGQSLNPFVSGGLLSRMQNPTKATLESHNAMVINFDVGAAGGALFSQGTVMQGRIDEVNAAGEDIVVQCRDRSAFINETQIRTPGTYGSLAGIPLEDVLGQMLTDWGWSPSDLYVPVSPGFNVFPFPQDRGPLFDAMRTAALQIGWDLRYRPGDPSALTLYDPDRARTIPDAVFGPTRYSKLREFVVGDADVRNIWSMNWQDLDGVVHGPVERQDSDSMLRYGNKYAALWLQRGDLIRSDVAAGNYMDAALADSKDPLASHVVEMPMYLNVLLNDIHTYKANGRDYDTDLTFAVTGYTHHWTADPNTSPTTVIQCRQKPMAAFREYRPWERPPTTKASLMDPDDTDGAPDGIIHFKVTDLTP